MLIWIVGCLTQQNKSGTDEIGLQKEITPSVSIANPSAIYQSTDVGKKWMPYASGIPQEASVSSFLAIGEYLFANTDQYGIYRIIESDGKWFRIDLILP